MSKHFVAECPCCSRHVQLFILKCCLDFSCQLCFAAHKCQDKCLFDPSNNNQFGRQARCCRCQNRPGTTQCSTCSDRIFCKQCLEDIHSVGKYTAHSTKEVADSEGCCKQLMECTKHPSNQRRYILQSNILGCTKCADDLKCRKIQALERQPRQSSDNLQESIFTIDTKLQELAIAKTQLQSKLQTMSQQIQTNFSDIRKQIDEQLETALTGLGRIRQKQLTAFEELTQSYVTARKSMQCYQELKNIEPNVIQSKFRLVRESLNVYARKQSRLQNYEIQVFKPLSLFSEPIIKQIKNIGLIQSPEKTRVDVSQASGHQRSSSKQPSNPWNYSINLRRASNNTPVSNSSATTLRKMQQKQSFGNTSPLTEHSRVQINLENINPVVSQFTTLAASAQKNNLMKYHRTSSRLGKTNMSALVPSALNTSAVLTTTCPDRKQQCRRNMKNQGHHRSRSGSLAHK